MNESVAGWDRVIPEGVLRTWPTIPVDAWERPSEHRFLAPHNVSGYIWCVVSVFGETVGRPAKAGTASETFADLFEHAARLAASRVACRDGTPIVRPDNEANIGVVGRCWWCGKWPNSHEADTDCPEPRMAWDHIVIAEEADRA